MIRSAYSFGGMKTWVQLLLVTACCALPFTGFSHGETLLQIAAVTRQLSLPGHESDARLYLKRAELYREHQNWPAAEADYARAAELAPDLILVKVCRAGMLADSGELAAAGALFDAVLKENPVNGDAYVGRARTHVKQGEMTQAVEDYRNALANLSHPEPELFLELAEVCRRLDKLDEALSVLDDGMKKYGPIIPLQRLAVAIELERKAPASALARLDSLIDLADRKEEWFVQKGDVLLALGREGEARSAYEAALNAVNILPPRIQQSSPMVNLRNQLHHSLAALPANP